MQNTLRTFFNPTQRCSLKAQQDAAKKFDGKIIAYTDMKEWLSHLRPGELAGLPFFHVLATNSDDLRAAREALKARGVTLYEIDSGLQAAPGVDGDWVHTALDRYARRGLTKAEAEAMGRLGAKASPATKARTDRLPNELAEEILNNHQDYPTLKLALKAINNATDAKGKKFKRRWTIAHVYRMDKAGKLNLKMRRSGPKVKR